MSFAKVSPNQIKIAAIICTRPQFIKAVAISRAIVGHNQTNSSPATEEIIF
jgi:UDP-N-acetylglucosamine 2-epimerase